jgi:hypothetical protein
MTDIIKRGGTLRVLTCRVCNREFTRKKFQPVCCHSCNLIYKSNPHQANLQGATTNDNHNTSS